MSTIVNTTDVKIIGDAAMTSGDFLTFDPLPNNKFSLIIPNMESVTFFVQGFTLPTINVNEVIVETRVVSYNEIGEKLVFSPFEVSFLVDKYCRNYAAIYDWMKKMTVDGSSIGKSEDVVLMVNGKEFIRFFGCWPTSLSGMTLDSTVESVQYVKASVRLNYDYMSYIGEFKTVDSDYI